jgi:hypothetical protein
MAVWLVAALGGLLTVLGLRHRRRRHRRPLELRVSEEWLQTYLRTPWD